MKKALILVNLQNDFMPGGTLPVPNAHEIAPLANQLMPHFDFVVATQDWHPPNHVSFASQHPNKKAGQAVSVNGHKQALWPDHCVQKSAGAALVETLDQSYLHHIIYKGLYCDADSHSAFFDQHRKYATGLHTLLKFHQIADIYLLGVATDYSIKHSALDGLSLGYRVHVIHEACRGVDVEAGDSEKALSHLTEQNAKLVEMEEVQRGPHQQYFAFDTE